MKKIFIILLLFIGCNKNKTENIDKTIQQIFKVYYQRGFIDGYESRETNANFWESLDIGLKNRIK